METDAFIESIAPTLEAHFAEARKSILEIANNLERRQKNQTSIDLQKKREDVANFVNDYEWFECQWREWKRDAVSP
jgi:hypothetical protein